MPLNVNAAPKDFGCAYAVKDSNVNAAAVNIVMRISRLLIMNSFSIAKIAKFGVIKRIICTFV